MTLAARGDVSANTRLGYRYLTGSAGTIDSVQAYNYFATVASKSPAASAWMGYAVATRPELAGRGVDGVALVLKAANAGDPVGITLLGRLYQLGKGVPQNTPTARQLYANAGAGFALALTFLGETYLELANPADHAQAVPYFLSGAAAGETQSMVQLAVMYSRGDGITQDHSQAAQWLLKAAQRGDPVAAFRRGLLYYTGQGLPRSHVEAVALFRRSAVAGYTPARAALGKQYATGDGVPKDTNQAIHWLSLAAPTDPRAAAELALVRSGKPLN
jgi:hypothetical protein